MNKLLTTLIGLVAAGTMLPAFAGPDWQAIEQAHAHKRVQLALADTQTPQQACADKRLVLPLDHGPRAQSTPYLNAQRKQRFEAKLRACNEAAAKEGKR